MVYDFRPRDTLAIINFENTKKAFANVENFVSQSNSERILLSEALGRSAIAPSTFNNHYRSNNPYLTNVAPITFSIWNVTKIGGIFYLVRNTIDNKQEAKDRKASETARQQEYVLAEMLKFILLKYPSTLFRYNSPGIQQFSYEWGNKTYKLKENSVKNYLKILAEATFIQAEYDAQGRTIGYKLRYKLEQPQNS